MTDAAIFPTPMDRYREHAIAALAPFFVDEPGRSLDQAFMIARQLLEDYEATTPREVQLAAQVIALSCATLGCLSSAAAAFGLRAKDMLAIHDSALALERQSQKAQKALDACRSDRTAAANTRWDEGTFQLVINRALDDLEGARATLAVHRPDPPFLARKSVPEISLPILSAQPMTPGVLAGRGRATRRTRRGTA